MGNLALRLNFEGKAPTQYENYSFESMAFLGDRPIGIDENGIYELFAGDSDNGENIEAYFNLPQSNLRSSYNKRLRSIYLGCRADGDLLVTIRDDDENEHTYQMHPTKVGKQHTSKLPCGRNFHKGCYYSVRIGNVNGSYFDIDYMQIVPIMLARQPGGF